MIDPWKCLDCGSEFRVLEDSYERGPGGCVHRRLKCGDAKPMIVPESRP